MLNKFYFQLINVRFYCTYVKERCWCTWCMCHLFCTVCRHLLAWARATGSTPKTLINTFNKIQRKIAQYMMNECNLSSETNNKATELLGE